MSPERAQAARRAAVALVLALGVVVTVATSQPQWQIQRGSLVSFSLEQGSLFLEASTSRVNVEQANSVGLELGPMQGDAAAYEPWRVSVVGATQVSPEGQPRPLEPQPLRWMSNEQGQLHGYVGFFDAKLPCDAQSPTCAVVLRLDRGAGDLAPLSVEAQVWLSARGHSDPPGSNVLSLRVRQP